MTLVADTGPLIALATVGRLDLLNLFPEVLVPPAVEAELLAKDGEDRRMFRRALREQIRVIEPTPSTPEVARELAQLGLGEGEAIALAHQGGHLLLLEDRLGRLAARRLGVSVTGLVGLLITAKQRGMIPRVLPLLREIRHLGYWLSDEILETVGRLADEF